MGIFLLLLKILLFILIFLLCILILILFVPIKHKVFICLENKDIKAQVNVSWLFGILYIMAAYADNKTDVVFKIFGVTPKFFSRSEPQEREGDSPDKFDNSKKPETLKDDKNKKSEKLKNSQSDKSLKKKKDKSQNDKSDKERIIEKIKHVYDYPGKKEIIKSIKKLLIGLYNAIRPKVFRLNGTIGLETPDVTAYIIGGLSALRPVIKKPYSLNLKGDFENQIIDVNLSIRGSIYLIRLIIPSVQFILSKPIWKLIKELKSFI